MGFRTVFVKNGEKLSLKLDNLEVRKSDQKYVIPLIDIDTIILEGDYTVITTRILSAISKYHIAVVICDQKYLPVGMYLGVGQYHRSAKRAIWQASWTESQKELAWTEIVRQKIINQIQMTQLIDTPESRHLLMIDYLDNLMVGDSTNREGHVAKVYFNTLFGNGFSRRESDFTNHCLDYGYAIIRAQMARCVSASGLLPMLGIHHKNEYNSYNLVDDLMEPFRPIIDYFVYTDILRREESYLSYQTRIDIINFLNQILKVNNKNIFIMQAINDYVLSFVKAMEKEDFSLLLDIQLNNLKKVTESEV